MEKRHFLSKEKPRQRMGFPRVEKFILQNSPLTFHSKISDGAPLQRRHSPPGESTIIVPVMRNCLLIISSARNPSNYASRPCPQGETHFGSTQYSSRNKRGPLHGTPPRLINFLCNLTARRRRENDENYATAHRNFLIVTSDAYPCLRSARPFPSFSLSRSFSPLLQFAIDSSLAPREETAKFARVLYACFYATASRSFARLALESFRLHRRDS